MAARGAAADGLDAAAVRALPADAFAALLLGLGRYRVDLGTGAVVSAHTGRPMAPQRNAQTGYYQVLLSYRPVAAKPITVHRLVALAAWGLAAIRGRHVVHRDGDRAHNAVANLLLVDAPPRSRRPPGVPPPAGAPRRPPAPPCARCGTTGGWTPDAARPPRRMSGARFGLTGRLCAVCYENLARIERRRARGPVPRGRPRRRNGSAGARRRARVCPVRRRPARPDPRVPTARPTGGGRHPTPNARPDALRAAGRKGARRGGPTPNATGPGLVAISGRAAPPRTTASRRAASAIERSGRALALLALGAGLLVLGRAGGAR